VCDIVKISIVTLHCYCTTNIIDKMMIYYIVACIINYMFYYISYNYSEAGMGHPLGTRYLMGGGCEGI
jgi:hypothetical protein